jgi:hypothetical protein
MIESEFLKIANILAVKIYFHENSEVCATIVTRNKKYFVNTKKNNFFDLIRNKNICIPKILDYEILFCSHISMFELLNDKNINQESIDEQFNWNFKYIKELKKSNRQEILNMTNILKKLSLNELHEYCRETLFFVPVSTVRADIINECKERKKFLLATVDHGIFSKILALFDINDEDFIRQDPAIVNKCKEKWKTVITYYINKAKYKLNKELEENKNDTDLIVEVNEITKILDDITTEIDTKVFKSPKEIVSYWPELLRPAPLYVLEN